MLKKKRVANQRIVVVLEGIKSFLKSNAGVAPLSKAMHDVIGPEDQVLVLALLYWNADGNDDVTPLQELDPNMEFLYQEICQRKEAYARVFKPFYRTCQEYGVKFEVKIAAGFRPKDIVLEEANNTKANWIVMDSCFAKDISSVNLSATKCNVISVKDSGEAIFHSSSESSSSQQSSTTTTMTTNKPKPSSHNYNSKHLKPLGNPLCCALPPLSEPSYSPSPSPSNHFSKLSKFKIVVEPHIMERSYSSFSLSAVNDVSTRKACDPNVVLGLPLQLSKEAVGEITLGFSKKISSDENMQFVVFDGFFALYRTRVLVKMFRGVSGRVFLEAEKKAALSMRHKNILTLIGYNQSEDTTFLVFPFAERGTLDLNLSGLLGKEFKLTFHDKLNIAIKIAQGLRYMHEECPLGPIVHGKLLLGNVFLGDDLSPQISGFAGATWLHLKHAWPIFLERYKSSEDCLDHNIMVQVKSDVLSFGVLLLRLFCSARSVPQDDYTLITWARPLLLERAFHKLLDDEDEESEDMDMHEMFRVMCTAFQCAMTRPENRPFMSQVISYLKGESFCVMQSSP